MRLSDTLLPEWDHEMANTRKTLERVPDEKLDWKPHEKSSAMGALATHLANIPTWAIHTLTKDSLDLAPVGEPPPRVTKSFSRCGPCCMEAIKSWPCPRWQCCAAS